MSSVSGLDSISNGAPETIIFQGKNYSIPMTWKYLEFLLHRMPKEFSCIAEVLKGPSRDINMLDLALRKIEAGSNVSRAAIFQQVLNASAKQQTPRQKQEVIQIAQQPQSSAFSNFLYWSNVQPDRTKPDIDTGRLRIAQSVPQRLTPTEGYGNVTPQLSGSSIANLRSDTVGKNLSTVLIPHHGMCRLMTQNNTLSLSESELQNPAQPPRIDSQHTTTPVISQRTIPQINNPSFTSTLPGQGARGFHSQDPHSTYCRPAFLSSHSPKDAPNNFSFQKQQPHYHQATQQFYASHNEKKSHQSQKQIIPPQSQQQNVLQQPQQQNILQQPQQQNILQQPQQQNILQQPQQQNILQQPQQQNSSQQSQQQMMVQQSQQHKIMLQQSQQHSTPKQLPQQNFGRPTQPNILQQSPQQQNYSPSPQQQNISQQQPSQQPNYSQSPQKQNILNQSPHPQNVLQQPQQHNIAQQFKHNIMLQKSQHISSQQQQSSSFSQQQQNTFPLQTSVIRPPFLPDISVSQNSSQPHNVLGPFLPLQHQQNNTAYQQHRPNDLTRGNVSTSYIRPTSNELTRLPNSYPSDIVPVCLKVQQSNSHTTTEGGISHGSQHNDSSLSSKTSQSQFGYHQSNLSQKQPQPSISFPTRIINQHPLRPPILTSHIQTGSISGSGHVTNNLFGPQAVVLTVRRIRELCHTRKLNYFFNEDGCAQVILNFLTYWVGHIWAESIDISFKRVDCPPTPLDSFVINDIELMADVEKYRTYETSEISRYQAASHALDNTERTPTSCVKGEITHKKNNKNNSGNVKYDDIGEGQSIGGSHSTKKTVSRQQTHPSLDALKELGLEDSLFSFNETNDLDSHTLQQSSHPNDNPSTSDCSSLAVLRRTLLAEAEARAKEMNAVRRKQGKLTREVTVEDLLTALKTRSNQFPMPIFLREELLRFFYMSLNSIPILSESTNHTSIPSLVQNYLSAWKSTTVNCIFPKPLIKRSSSTLDDPTIQYLSNSNNNGKLRKRFTDVWTEQLLNNNNTSTASYKHVLKHKDNHIVGGGAPILTDKGYSQGSRCKRRRPVNSSVKLNINDSSESVNTHHQHFNNSYNLHYKASEQPISRSVPPMSNLLPQHLFIPSFLSPHPHLFSNQHHSHNT